jgi:phage shock protein A
VQVRLDDAEKNVVDLKNQYTQLIKRKKDLEVNIMAMEQQYKEQMQFSCDKIQ